MHVFSHMLIGPMLSGQRLSHTCFSSGDQTHGTCSSLAGAQNLCVILPWLRVRAHPRRGGGDCEEVLNVVAGFIKRRECLRIFQHCSRARRVADCVASDMIALMRTHARTHAQTDRHVGRGCACARARAHTHTHKHMPREPVTARLRRSRWHTHMHTQIFVLQHSPLPA